MRFVVVVVGRFRVRRKTASTYGSNYFMRLRSQMRSSRRISEDKKKGTGAFVQDREQVDLLAALLFLVVGVVRLALGLLVYGVA